ncbi:MAG: GNAT family N-acetyltransferase [Celeribacter sp.]|jgi:putative acetyltransferase
MTEHAAPLPPRLRPARADDAPRLAQIVASAAAEQPAKPAFGADTPHPADALLTRILTELEVDVAIPADSPAPDRADAFVVRDGAHLEALYVAPEARGQGLGSALLSRLKAQHPRLTLWVLEANAAARRFYTRHGFYEEVHHAAPDAPGLSDIHMVWEARK